MARTKRGRRSSSGRGSGTKEDRKPRWKRFLRRGLFTAIQLSIVAVLAWFVVRPRMPEPQEMWDLLGDVSPLLLVLGLLLQGAAIFCHAEVLRALLPKKGRPSRPTMMRVEYADMAVSHTAPVASIAGTALVVKFLHDRGARAADVGFAEATRVLGGAVVIILIIWPAVVFSLPWRGFTIHHTIALVTGAVVLGVFAMALFAFGNGGKLIKRVVRRISRPIPFLDSDQLADGTGRQIELLREIRTDRKLMGKAVGWSAANRITDAASLWVFLTLFGIVFAPDRLLIGWGLGLLISGLPLTPGGLGPVEAVLITVLAAFEEEGQVALGVLTYRIAQYWLPTIIGAVTYLTLVTERTDKRPKG